jgi:hypothetical protein
MFLLSRDLKCCFMFYCRSPSTAYTWQCDFILSAELRDLKVVVYLYWDLSPPIISFCLDFL